MSAPPDDPVPGRTPVRSHWIPRTTVGRVAVLLFLGLMALAQPPIVHGFADRIEPWVVGVPFLYAYLFAVYVGMIAVLLWAAARTRDPDG